MLQNILASSLVFIVFIVIIVIIIQVFNARGLKKSREYMKTLQEGLKPGKEVMLNNGIYGKLTLVKQDYVKVEIANGVEIKANRFSIKEIVN